MKRTSLSSSFKEFVPCFIPITMMKKESISCTNLFLNDFSCLCQIKDPCEARAKKKIVKGKIIAHFR